MCSNSPHVLEVIQRMNSMFPRLFIGVVVHTDATVAAVSVVAMVAVVVGNAHGPREGSGHHAAEVRVIVNVTANTNRTEAPDPNGPDECDRQPFHWDRNVVGRRRMSWTMRRRSTRRNKRNQRKTRIRNATAVAKRMSQMRMRTRKRKNAVRIWQQRAPSLQPTPTPTLQSPCPE